MYNHNILSLIPQQPPFVMVDELLFCDETTARSTFRVEADNMLVINGQFSEAGLMENIAQTVAAGAGYLARNKNEPVVAGYIGAVRNLEVFSLPGISDQLITEVTKQNQVFNITLISGKVSCNNVLIAACEMTIFLNK